MTRIRMLATSVLAATLAVGTLAACQKGDKSGDKSADKADQSGKGATTDTAVGTKGADVPGLKPPRGQKKQVEPPLPLSPTPADATKTASGLVFKSLAAGTGASPGKNDTVQIKYSAWRPDGTTFATTEPNDQPTTMPLHSAAPGFREALGMMKIGGKAMFWVPPEIGYPRRTPPNAEQLVYAVELVGITPAPATPADVGKPPGDSKKEASGVAWKKVKTNAGGKKPRAWDGIELAYTGWDAEGAILDTTEVGGRPIKVGVEQLPPVFAEVVPALAAGERARVWFPAELLGGQMPGAPAGMLTFEVEVVSVVEQQQPPAAPADVAKPPADAKKTPKGVFYKVLAAGKDGPTPTANDMVKVHYTGWTTDGKRFDSSIPGGEPREFRVTGVIQGWTDALLMMKVGDKWRVWIPEELAYKGAPNRPQGMLVFDVELLGIKPAGGGGGHP